MSFRKNLLPRTVPGRISPMIQYIILGYLVYEILRLSSHPDASAAKFSPPPVEPAAAPPAEQPPPAPKSETASSKAE